MGTATFDLKRTLLAPLLVPGVAGALSAVTGARATIFMLHRFAVPALGVEGHDPRALRHDLAHLRRRGRELVSLEEMFRRLEVGEPLRGAVAFTIDDGYFDHARVAAPVFAELGCPVTIFVTTGFVDGLCWFWWDKLTVVFETTAKSIVRLRLAGEELVYTLDSAAARRRANADLNLRLTNVSEAERRCCVDDLARLAGVELPVVPPPRFAPMSWDEARALEGAGVSFGPHTVTHPILSSAPDAQATLEITESWRRLAAEVAHPVPVFCYPNGRSSDFGSRETEVLRRLGLCGAVTGEPAPVDPSAFRRSAAARFAVPRYGFRDDLPFLLQSVCGLEALKARLRRS